MDFGALPPEVNSGRMYLGPGPATMLGASAGWESLAAELQTAASGYQSVISSLTDESWLGPVSMSMAAAVTPYVSWMMATATQCEEAASQAAAAAAAYEAAFAMTLPPPLVVANRVQLMTLVATNFLGQNTPAIMATEAEYSEMWAQDATAMYNYAAGSASASSFTTFTSPPQTTNPGGLAGQAGAVAQATATQVGSNVQTTSAQLISSVPQALQGLATPGSSASGLSGMVMGDGASAASAAYSPLSALTSLGNSPGKSAVNAVKSATSGTSAASGMSGLASFLESPAGVAFGVGSGVGADAGGVAADVGGLGMDFFGVGLDLTGVQTLSEGAGGLGSVGGILGDLGGVGGLASLDGIGGTEMSAGLGQANSLGTLSVPPSWANAVSSVAPLPALDANVMPGTQLGAMPAAATGVSKLPLGGMVGRESEGTVQRVGFRASLIPRSPVAG
jgi:PPE-repeat protein